MLALDHNQNGTFDNQSELFGNGEDGSFNDLATYDTNKDGFITNQDMVWQHLRMWIDGNTDGITGSSELKTMDELGMESINLTYDTVEEIHNGNDVTGRGTFTRITDGGKKIISTVIETFFGFLPG